MQTVLHFASCIKTLLAKAEDFFCICLYLYGEGRLMMLCCAQWALMKAIKLNDKCLLLSQIAVTFS